MKREITNISNIQGLIIELRTKALKGWRSKRVTSKLGINELLLTLVGACLALAADVLEERTSALAVAAGMHSVLQLSSHSLRASPLRSRAHTPVAAAFSAT